MLLYGDDKRSKFIGIKFVNYYKCVVSFFWFVWYGGNCRRIVGYGFLREVFYLEGSCLCCVNGKVGVFLMIFDVIFYLGLFLFLLYK